VATIGNGQNVLYRVEGSGDLRGQNATCLHRADGSQIRCGPVVDTGSNGVGVAIGGGDAAPTGELGALTDQQLGDLARRVADETARRLGDG
jgi:hypothetical protein